MNKIFWGGKNNKFGWFAIEDLINKLLSRDFYFGIKLHNIS
jgi:hypothetical protein